MVEDLPTNEDSAAEPIPEKGIDLVRSVLAQARAMSGTKADSSRALPSRRTSVKPRRTRGGWSGARPDDRDPQLLGFLTQQVARRRGWSEKVSVGTVLGLWPSVVGDDIAEHAHPTGLEDGVLIVQAESTAWATQLRYMQSQILARIASSVGNGVVTKLRILGPVRPSWHKGKRHISGRGPRDTYG
ncbi:DUF721 domain-containing protein [Hoyosella rhizosphaerae]|uniref:UPF0232 protein GCM10011410_15780 n=1 Tax=Hoyosella rhizosphaerae TaxID=1755582 RepID=A0A916XDQ3_9ACTN|nr:DUF721 domain-containing protein [Hoyosella rhizosphaerae]MBN4927476.1 DUF721 domain-containing protein [Hoyosella rhizosphaerae]GGC64155.1 UPF0232 protein [Hoyosella rhizosphaerae]